MSLSQLSKAGFLLCALVLTTQQPGQSQPTKPFLKEPAPMSWKTECIGRVLMDMPKDRPHSWSSEFDDAEVRRLQRPLSLNQLWAGAEVVRNQYERQTHRKHTSRLGHFERLDVQKAALVIGYASPNSFFAPTLWRFAHIDDQHAYEFKQTLDIGNIAPTAQLFKPYIDKYAPVLTRMHPLRDGEIPSRDGLCIDGAVVSGDTGKNAVTAINAEIASGTYLGLSYRENLYRVSMTSTFEDLANDQKRAEFGLTLNKESLGYRSFKVLRKQERTLAGLRGQEFITRTALNNGHVYYAMQWGTTGSLESKLAPQITVHLTTPDSPTDSQGKPYTALPPEQELIALWDSALATFKVRPGALPDGLQIKAVN